MRIAAFLLVLLWPGLLAFLVGICGGDLEFAVEMSGWALLLFYKFAWPYVIVVLGVGILLLPDGNPSTAPDVGVSGPRSDVSETR